MNFFNHDLLGARIVTVYLPVLAIWGTAVLPQLYMGVVASGRKVVLVRDWCGRGHSRVRYNCMNQHTSLLSIGPDSQLVGWFVVFSSIC